MDFFASQDHARTRTRWLIVLFVAAVLLTCIAVYGVYFLTLGRRVPLADEPNLWRALGTALWDPVAIAICTGSTLAVILCGSGWKILSLSAGGGAVARSLGGRRVSPGTADPLEQRLLNVVEEMAIASGLPVPDVYLLDQESGINAFAAGFTSSDAAVGVTRGCVEKLSRDELQGVVAHEFSHILSGDMRLNLRLIGVLFGLLLIGLIGRGLMRAGFRAGSGRNKGGAAAIGMLGLGIFIVGSVGLFFSRLIQAAVSRQREYLADAAAVQFTRNPAGLAGALRRIGAFPSGGQLENPSAAQASHLLFADGLRAGFSGMLSTHPPLAERIRRLDPTFDGAFSASRGPEPFAAPIGSLEATGTASSLAREPVLPPPHAERPAPAVLAIVDAVGTPGAQDLALAQDILSHLSAYARQGLREPDSAAQLACALLLNEEPEVLSRQKQQIAALLGNPAVPQVERWRQEVSTLLPHRALPLLNLALPALRELDPLQSNGLVKLARNLVQADNRVTFLEFCLHKVLSNHLLQSRPGHILPGLQGFSLHAVRAEALLLLGAMAWSGSNDATSAERAFQAGLVHLPWKDATCPARASIDFEGLNAALDRLQSSCPAIRKSVLMSCASAIDSDGTRRLQEVDLLRAVADTLMCPVPLAQGA